jgi:hypothetical protein
MQKYLFYSLSLLFIFFIFLGLSIEVKEFYKIEGDYLSSFSTLIAALVAFALYKDWREEQEYQTKKEFILNIKNIFKELYDLNFSEIDRRVDILVSLKNVIPNSDLSYKSMTKINAYKGKYSALSMHLLMNLKEYEIVSGDSIFIKAALEELEKQNVRLQNSYDELFGSMNLAKINYDEPIEKMHNFNNCTIEVIGDIYNKIVIKLINKLRPRDSNL